MRRAGRRRLGEQQPYPEQAALAGRALHRNFAAQDLRQQFGNGQPKSGARHRIGRRQMSTLERFENLLYVFRPYAVSGVGHGKLRHLAAFAHP